MFADRAVLAEWYSHALLPYVWPHEKLPCEPTSDEELRARFWPPLVDLVERARTRRLWRRLRAV